MRILFTICGRAGSQGLKNKNLKNLYKKPLVGYVLSVIELYKKTTDNQIDIALNTDSIELKQLVDELADDVLYVPRKEHLTSNTVGKIKVIKDTYATLKDELNKEYDLIVDLDITSPLRTKQDLENLIKKHQVEKDKDIIFSVVASRRNPYFNMVKVNDSVATIVIPTAFTSRQQAPKIYDMNASMYSYKPSFLEQHDYIFDGRCGYLEMEETLILDIDDEEDFYWLEFLMPKFLEERSGILEVYENIKYLR